MLRYLIFLLLTCLLFLTGCFQEPEISLSCQDKPDRELKKDEVITILTDNNNFEQANTIKNNINQGYTFLATPYQRLTITKPENSCIWLYTPTLERISINNNGLNTINLRKTGFYIIHIFSNQDINKSELQVKLSLSSPLKEALKMFDSRTKQALVDLENTLTSPPYLKDTSEQGKTTIKNQFKTFLKQELNFEGNYDQALKSNGRERESLIIAIAEYQKNILNFYNSDGIIDPQGLTYKSLKNKIDLKLYPLTEQEAMTIIKNWLSTKEQVFAKWKYCNKSNQNNSDCQNELKQRDDLAQTYTTGSYYTNTKKNIDDLQKQGYYYDYQVSQVNKTVNFLPSDQSPKIILEITEKIAVGTEDKIIKNNPQKTLNYQFTFAKNKDQWKISASGKILG